MYWPGLAQSEKPPQPHPGAGFVVGIRKLIPRCVSAFIGQGVPCGLISPVASGPRGAGFRRGHQHRKEDRHLGGISWMHPVAVQVF